MERTKIMEATSEAYIANKRFIINKGGTRSSKTYSVLSLLFLIAVSSQIKLIITIVSHSIPHLITGAIRDFDNILMNEGFYPDEIRIKNPYIYTINRCIIEFIGFDRIAKAIGVTRDILFINEADKIAFDICHQLIQRTKKTIFIDYNPTNEFWIDTEGYTTSSDAVVIHSTFEDNRDNLTKGQIDDFERARLKAEQEDAKDQRGYWWNWWRVYGLGLEGQVEGAILTNWEKGEFDNSLPYCYGEDFGVKHFDALVKCAVDRQKKRIYWKEEIFMNGLSTDDLYSIIRTRNVNKKLILADSANSRIIIDLKKKGLNIKPAIKDKIIEDIKLLMDYTIIVDPSSINLIRQLTNWIWLDKKGEIPADEDDDLIDAGRYGTMLFIRPVTAPKGQKVLK